MNNSESVYCSFFICVIIVFSLAGCDSLITKSQEDVPTPNNFNADSKSNAEKLVNSTYYPWFSNEFNSLYGKDLRTASGVLSDDGDSRLKSGYPGLRNWTFTPSNRVIEGWYSLPYRSINNVNYAIQKISEGSLSSDEKAPYIAEARFMRGFSYLWLVNFYGGVPLFKKHLETLKDYDNPRAPVDSIYALIIKDFTFAKENLGVQRKYIPTQATAAAYLAKAYLYEKKYERSEIVARQAIKMARNEGFRMIDSYPDMFTRDNERNPSLLFYLQYLENPFEYGEQHSITANIRDIPKQLSFIQGKGWGYTLPSRDLYDAYEENDPRRDYTLYSPGSFLGIYNKDEAFKYTYQTYNNNCEKVTRTITYQKGDTVRYIANWSPTGLNVKKLTVDFNTVKAEEVTGLDRPLMRMAELYLILAEDLAMQKDNEALKWVNKVRSRPSVDMPPKTASDGSLIDIVKHERRVELAMESSHRIEDLIRWNDVKKTFGNGKKVPDNYYSKCLENDATRKYFQAPGLSRYPTDHILFAIPQYEIDQNSKINQNNPGY